MPERRRHPVTSRWRGYAAGGAALLGVAALAAPLVVPGGWRTAAVMAQAEAMVLPVGLLVVVSDPLKATASGEGSSPGRHRRGRLVWQLRRRRIYWRLGRRPLRSGLALVVFVAAVLSWHLVAPALARYDLVGVDISYAFVSLGAGVAFWSRLVPTTGRRARGPCGRLGVGGRLGPGGTTALIGAGALVTNLANAADMAGVVPVPASLSRPGPVHAVLGPGLAQSMILDAASAMMAVAFVVAVLAWLRVEDGSTPGRHDDQPGPARLSADGRRTRRHVS